MRGTRQEVALQVDLRLLRRIPADAGIGHLGAEEARVQQGSRELADETRGHVSDEVEVETQTFQVLPKEVTDEIGSVKLFNKWRYEDVEIRDISLTYGISRTFQDAL